MIAGEPSGDALGGSLLAVLRQKYPDIVFSGIGGPLMEESGGFVSLFPYTELCHMGIGSVLKNGISLIKRYYQAVNAIFLQRPDLLLTIDCPDFSLRVSHSVRKITKRIHCVAPSVWAWRKSRARTLEKKTDYLLHLFEFEKKFFPKIPCFWVGHPLADQSFVNRDVFWSTYPSFSSLHPLLCILPGSRISEIKRCWPVFKQSVELLRRAVKNLQVVIVTLPEHKELFEQEKYLVVTDSLLKKSIFLNSTAALACSGTVTLELALCGTPMVIGYRVHCVLAWILRRLITTPYVGLVNILAKKMVAPEYLQENFTPEGLESALKVLLNSNQISKDPQNFEKIWSNVKTPLGFAETSTKVIADVLNLA
ncbi:MULTISPECIES: lipid-A-disaccharide synthase [Holospora]|uniref:lipid-A-disaccharide synthase n=1 Tax=Holospora TaxID=44747 RepID=UPI00032E7C1E|nr:MULTISPECIES: lipid-A-disaccharide synthase [Holospora]